MTQIPFQLYSEPLPISVYGHIYRIPDYYTPSELHLLHSYVSNQRPMDAIIYPNQQHPHAFESRVSSKTQWFYDNWDVICDMTETEHVSPWGYVKDTPSRIHEVLQSSPMGMRRYPRHSDLGVKCLTILVPIHPCRGVSTTFYGGDDGDAYGVKNDGVTLDWDVNVGYMFRPSRVSFHSYEGLIDSDRYVMNVNLLV